MTIDQLRAGAALSDAEPLTLTGEQKETATRILAELAHTRSERVRELTLDELADFLGIERKAVSKRVANLVIEKGW